MLKILSFSAAIASAVSDASSKSSKSPPMVVSIQLLYFLTLVYTPGIPSVAQPTPQLTTPAMQDPSSPSCSHTSGPPLSPWQASLSSPPAQIMVLSELSQGYP